MGCERIPTAEPCHELSAKCRAQPPLTQVSPPCKATTPPSSCKPTLHALQGPAFVTSSCFCESPTCFGFYPEIYDAPLIFRSTPDTHTHTHTQRHRGFDTDFLKRLAVLTVLNLELIVRVAAHMTFQGPLSALLLAGLLRGYRTHVQSPNWRVAHCNKKLHVRDYDLSGIKSHLRRSQSRRPLILSKKLHTITTFVDSWCPY